MIVHKVAQNTPEWRALRAGIPTASAMDKIITPTGRNSSQAEKYKFRLLAERIIGHPLDEGPFSWAMEQGSSLEKSALKDYQFQTDYQTEPCGFVTDDRERYGASPDQLVGDTGLLEIKCPTIETHMMYLMNEGSAYEEYKIQAQAQLWICEREWVDFLSYHPDLPWSLFRMRRDEPFIAKLKAAVEAFCDDLDRLAAEAQSRGWFRRESIRVPAEDYSQANLVRALKDSLREMKK